jgi:predicted XRE-type DNA-binding protein
MSDEPIITRDVWEALADTPEEAENLRVRSMLMMEITAVVARNGWSQRHAATELGLTQPRTSDLVNGKLDKFSLDALVNIGAKLGLHLHLAPGLSA